MAWISSSRKDMESRTFWSMHSKIPQSIKPVPHCIFFLSENKTLIFQLPSQTSESALSFPSFSFPLPSHLYFWQTKDVVFFLNISLFLWNIQTLARSRLLSLQPESVTAVLWHLYGTCTSRISLCQFLLYLAQPIRMKHQFQIGLYICLFFQNCPQGNTLNWLLSFYVSALFPEKKRGYL